MSLNKGQTFGPDSRAPFPLQRRSSRPLHALKHRIRKPTGEPTSRAGRGKTGLPGAQTRVSTVSAGVVHRNPTKHF